MNSSADRQRLVESIEEWNANRLELFRLALPDETGMFNGVVRFFFQNTRKTYQTKCIRITNRDTTFDVVSILLSKFFPHQADFYRGRFRLYEHQINSVRRLEDDEFPLVVQLKWNVYAREGKFVLCFESENRFKDQKKQVISAKHSVDSKSSTIPFRRRWSSRWGKDNKGHNHASPIGCAAAIMRQDKQPFSESRLNCLVPAGNSKRLVPDKGSGSGNEAMTILSSESSFFRTISLPETASSEKQRWTLQAKVQQILQNDSQAVGGTLKIYGGDVCPTVPYKTLLVSSHDRVGQVVRQSLEKYGLDSEAESDAYCLIMRTRSTSEVANGLPGCKEILSDEASLIDQFFARTSNVEPSTVVTFELHHRPGQARPYHHHQHHLHHPFSSTSSVAAASLCSSSTTSSSTSPLPLPNQPPVAEHCQPSLFPYRPSPTAVKPYGRTAQSICQQQQQQMQQMALMHQPQYPMTCGDTAGQWSLPHLVEIAVGDDPGKGSHRQHIHTLPVHSGEVCIGTATRPDREHPLLVSLSSSAWPEVEPHHLLIWRPTGQLSNNSCRGGTGTSTDSPGSCLSWLACRPCVSTCSSYRRPSLSHLPLCKVFINNQLLVASHYNQAAVYWLSPGDLIRFGRQGTERQLQIWPGQSTARSALGPVGNGSVVAEDALAGFAHFLSPLVQNSPHQLFIGPFSPAVDRSFLAPTALTNPVSGGSSTITIAAAAASASNQDNTSPSESSYASSSSLSGTGGKPVPLGSRHETTRPGGTEGVTDHRPPDPLASPSAKSPSASLCSSSAQIGWNAACQVKLASPFHPIPRAQQQPPTLSFSSFATSETAAVILQVSNSTVSSTAATTTSSSTTTTRASPSYRSSHKACKPSSSSSSSSSSSTVSDRLPCQLAFAPGSVRDLLNWVITRHLQQQHLQRSHQLHSVSDRCPLGPGLTVYLMLRAIYRQCDRWEGMERKRAAAVAEPYGAETSQEHDKVSTSNLTSLSLHQLHRRQRELLTLLVGAVEHFQSFESWAVDRLKCEHPGSSTATTSNGTTGDPLSFISLLASIATWLANSSQLLHLVTRDKDLARTFQRESVTDPKAVPSHNDDSVGGGDEQPQQQQTVCTAWAFVLDQLAEVVQSAFGLLTELCSVQLDQTEAPHLLARLEAAVLKIDFAAEQTNQKDRFIAYLDNCLNSLHRAQVNPAFTVQLVARLLHRLNARLFNHLVDRRTLSPAWGHVLHSWLRADLMPWAVANGLAGAVDCHLTRVSQAAELLLADMSCVESLYNSVVDLVGLNSRQVSTLLEAYRLDSAEEVNDSEGAAPAAGGSVSRQWIDFVVSGVQLVADRIMADQQRQREQEGGETSEEQNGARDHDDALSGSNHTSWDPNLHEPLNLKLPLLLPEDGFYTDTPSEASAHGADDPHSCDSGISSRPSSTKGLVNGAADRPELASVISVDSVRAFLDFPIKSSWCRLSVRPLPAPTTSSPTASSPPMAYSSWDVYLAKQQGCPSVSLPCSMPLSTSAELATRLSAGLSTETPGQPTDQQAPVSPNVHPSTICNRHLLNGSDALPGVATADQTRPVQLCHQHQPITVIVPKVGQSLGLSIVAVKSEDDGRDLGIYIRGILPDGGASQAYLADENDEHQPGIVLQPGDRLLAVDGQPVTGVPQEAAAHLVASGGDQVWLTLVRHCPRSPGGRHPANGWTASARCVECELRSSLGDSSLIRSDTIVGLANNSEAEPNGEQPPRLVRTTVTLASVPVVSNSTVSQAPVNTGSVVAKPPTSLSPAQPRSPAVPSVTPSDLFSPVVTRGGSLLPAGTLDTSTACVHHRQDSDTVTTAPPIQSCYRYQDNKTQPTGLEQRLTSTDEPGQFKSTCYRTCRPSGPTSYTAGRVSGSRDFSGPVSSSLSASHSSPVDQPDTRTSYPRENRPSACQKVTLSVSTQSGSISTAASRTPLTIGSKAPDIFVPTASVLPCRSQPAHQKLPRNSYGKARSSRSLNDLRSTAHVTYLPGYHRQQMATARHCGGDSSSLSLRRVTATPTSGGGPRALLSGGRSLQRRHTVGPAFNWCSMGPRPEPPNKGRLIATNRSG